MRYIKIREKTYNAALMKLRMDHGEDAIPISHKYIKEGGLFNSRVFGKSVVELTAAVQDQRKKAKAAPRKSTIDVKVGDERPAANKKSPMQSINATIDELNNNLDSLKSSQNSADVIIDDMPSENSARDIRKPKFEAVNSFEKEFNDIKETLQKLLSERGAKQDNPGYMLSEDDMAFKPFEKILRDNDYDQEECHLIINEVKHTISKDDLKDKYKIEKSFKDLIKSRIVTSGAIERGNKKKVIMFCGPTGVGKTTTMAKLGAMFSLREGSKVAFVTIDNYRIAATEQLKKYAEIMRIPVHVVSDQKEFRETIAQESAEIILVDTSGRSHRNDLKISEIKSYADQIEYDLEKVLCVSGNTKKTDLKAIFKSFDVIEFDSVIVTKVDETTFLGNIVDVSEKCNKPISYLTTGQEVPNDILVAESETIVEMMFNAESGQ